MDIFANVIEDDGSVLSTAITCAGLALADAGIPLYDIITAASIGIIDNKLWLDPTAVEEELCNNGLNNGQEHGNIVMARLATHDQISELWQSGSLSFDIVKKANKILLATTEELVPVIKKILVKKVLKNLKESTENEEALENE